MQEFTEQKTNFYIIRPVKVFLDFVRKAFMFESKCFTPDFATRSN